MASGVPECFHNLGGLMGAVLFQRWRDQWQVAWASLQIAMPLAIGTQSQTAARRAQVLCWFATGTLTALACAALWATVATRHQASSMQARISAWEVQVRKTRAATQQTQTPSDFTFRLPDEPFLAKLQATCTQADVKLGSFQAQPSAPVPGQLRHIQLTVTMAGGYPALKQVVADMLDQHANLGLARWTLHRRSGPADIEASVSFTLWARPAANAALPQTTPSQRRL